MCVYVTTRYTKKKANAMYFGHRKTASKVKLSSMENSSQAVKVLGNKDAYSIFLDLSTTKILYAKYLSQNGRIESE